MAWIPFGALPCRRKHLMIARASMLLKLRASLTCFGDWFLPGWVKNLSAPRYFSYHRLCVSSPVGENTNSFFVYCVPSIFTHFLFRSLYFPHLLYSLSIFQRNSKGVWLNLLNACSAIRFITLYDIMGVLLLSANIWKHQFHVCAYSYL